MLTLGYGAPEQFSNEAITTVTDTYTLGILLYELLTDKHPFNIKDKKPSRIENLILRKSPETPSKNIQKLSKDERTEIASLRDTTPLSLIQTLTGDLDALVMESMAQRIQGSVSFG
ncbi:protein kinase domain-containing protein [Fodinibius saliphilus]|uniref:protein kinase domain-containing protein n=1 Tax=Fodinibius saliphilus TaxID=1920650 RepID=UPI0011094DAF|nr:protein kinase [Fodinibius saliphilus]